MVPRQPQHHILMEMLAPGGEQGGAHSFPESDIFTFQGKRRCCQQGERPQLLGRQPTSPGTGVAKQPKTTAYVGIKRLPSPDFLKQGHTGTVVTRWPPAPSPPFTCCAAWVFGRPDQSLVACVLQCVGGAWAAAPSVCATLLSTCGTCTVNFLGSHPGVIRPVPHLPPEN